MHWIRSTTHLVAGLACAAALTGCGADALMEEGVEQAIEEGAGGGDTDVEFDGDGNFSMESKDGSFQVGSDELPEGFPTDAVPLLEGDIVTSSRFAEGEETAWSVTLMVDGDVETAFTEARDAVAAAGFDEVQSVDSDGFRSSALESADLRVNLTGLVGSDGATVAYTVTSSAP